MPYVLCCIRKLDESLFGRECYDFRRVKTTAIVRGFESLMVGQQETIFECISNGVTDHPFPNQAA